MAAGEQREAPSSKAFSASEFARSPSQTALTPILSASVIRPEAVPFRAALRATEAGAMEDDSQHSAPPGSSCCLAKEANVLISEIYGNAAFSLSAPHALNGKILHFFSNLFM